MESVADIAARYGASIAPGVVVQRLPTGVSSRPYPVWDGEKNQLVVPDWKEEAERQKRAGIRRNQAARKRGMAQDAALMARLIEMHAAGMRPPAIAAATGLKPDQVYRLLRAAGHRIERVNPGPSPETLRRLAEVRALVAQGKTRDEIAAALGFAQVRYLGQFVQRHAPDLVLPAVRRAKGGPVIAGPGRWDGFREGQEARIRALLAEGADEAAIGAALGIASRHLRRVIRRVVPDHVFSAAERFPELAERDAKIRRLIATMTVRDVAGFMGLTLGQAAASVRRSHAAGLIAADVAEARAARQTRAPGDKLVRRDAEVLPLVRDASYAEVGARLGLTLSQVKASVKRLRAEGKLPPAWAERMPMRVASMNGAAPRKATPTARILALAAEGVTIERIMAETGARRGTIRSVLARAGRAVVNERGAPRAARLAELPVLVAKGLTGAEIAARWGVDVQYVYRMASGAKIGLGYNAASWNKGEVSPRVAARRERVRQLYTGGATYAVMRAALHVSMGTLAADIKALGLSGTSGYALSRRRPAPDAVSERRAA